MVGRDGKLLETDYLDVAVGEVVAVVGLTVDRWPGWGRLAEPP